MLHLDWQQPWFKPWGNHGEKVQRYWQELPAQLHLALNKANAITPTGFSFVPQQDLPADMAYESFIFQHKQIPTRNNTHDFFNGLCWLRFPKTKTQLNHLQAQAIDTQGVGSQRGVMRDALTLFDENAALLFAPSDMWRALQHKQWQELFVTHRDDWPHTQLVLFGHALLEKLMKPYKGITAHVLCIPKHALSTDEQVDAWLCQQLTAERLKTKPFLPLPLSGIPGWWPGNQAPDFYEDKKVFRD